MKFIQINPNTQTIEAVESTGTLRDIYRLIDCRLIDVCARQDNGDALTVDDEALYQEPQPAAFNFDGYGPIHGITLVTGSDDEGETVEPLMTLEEVAAKVEWIGNVYTQPSLVIVPLYDLILTLQGQG